MFVIAELKKPPPSKEHAPEGLYMSVLRDSIRRIDSYCSNNEATFSMLLDSIDGYEPGARRKFRLEGIKAAGSEMFGSHRGYTCKALLEPPYQLKSHLYQNIQRTDWFCGLLGRYLTYTVMPEQYSDYKIISDYFGLHLQSVLKANSLRKNFQPENEE